MAAKGQLKRRPSLLIVLAVSKLCAAEFNIDTNCGQSPELLIVQKNPMTLLGQACSSKSTKNTSTLAPPSEGFRRSKLTASL
jgi:hypothetical protein